MKQINPEGRALIKRFEGLRLKAYPDPATGGDPWTIGYGHTGSDVTPGLAITEEKAEQLLRKGLSKFEEGVEKLCPDTDDNQFSALVSLAFNVGIENLRLSTLRRLHNAGEWEAAQEQFARWNKANKKVMKGLTIRRAAEAELYGKK